MEYKEKIGYCEKHGKTLFVEQFCSYACENCMGEDFEEMTRKEIEIIAEMNLNEVRF